MEFRLKRRKARLEGRLDQFLIETEQKNANSWKRKIFGNMGATEIDGGINMTSIGGEWNLLDLNGKHFGS